MDEQLNLMGERQKVEGEYTMSIAWSQESPRVRHNMGQATHYSEQ